MAESTGRRLAKNSAFLYFRMILLLIISFYTSRIILEKLGVEDFGVYNLVGSIVAMFSSLRTLFSSSTRRFLNYEMGRHNEDYLQTVFNTSIFINLFVVVLFFLAVETVGMWFLLCKMNIDPSRLSAALWVFHFSLISAMLSILVTSYDAVIIAHEKMDFYAYMSIFEGVLKLLIVFILSLFSADRLILYGFLLFCVSILVLIINFIYCYVNFPETHLKLCRDISLLKQMTAFAGWNFLGKTSYAFTQNGINMILNVFGGPVANAARGVAVQLNSAVNQFINNISLAVTPYSIKTYAEGDYPRFYSLTYISSKLYFVLVLCLAIPILLLTELVLSLWLGAVPMYSVEFVRLIMIWSIIRSVHGPIDTVFSSAGKMKFYQITESIVLALPIIFGYWVLSFGFDYWTIFVVMIVFEILNYTLILFVAKKQINFSISDYTRNVLIPCLITLLPLIGCVIINVLARMTLALRLMESLLVVMFSLGFMYLFGLNHIEKSYLKGIIKIKKNES